MPRFMIADADPASRKAIFLWLIYKMGIDEIVEAADGNELVKQMDESQPDIILMDWGLPNRPTLKYCQEIQHKKPALKWIILSVDSSVFDEAKDYSPWFLQKGTSPEQFFLLIQNVIKNLNK